MSKKKEELLYYDYQAAKCFGVLWEVFYGIPELRFEEIIEGLKGEKE